jgi:hypothetical protein
MGEKLTHQDDPSQDAELSWIAAVAATLLVVILAVLAAAV